MSTEDDAVRYETRIVKTVRGMEGRATAKWKSQGWEVVDQKNGRVSSEITIRRPKPKTPWKLFAGLGRVAKRWSVPGGEVWSSCRVM